MTSTSSRPEAGAMGAAHSHLADAEAIRAKARAITRRSPAYAQLTQWLAGLLEPTVASHPQPPPDQAAGRERLDQGQPMLDPTVLELDWDKARDLFLDLAGLVNAGQGNGSSSARLYLAVEGLKPGDAGPLALALTGDAAGVEALAHEHGLDPPVLALVLRLALRPQLTALAAWFAREALAPDWSQGVCPLCGGPPAMASLNGEGGARRLHCGRCETAWAFPRIHCPFCGNSDQQTLSYLSSDGEPGLRVDLCRACGGHVRTLDLRELDEAVVVPLDDLATWHLEALVKEHQDREQNQAH